mgnify:FL=1|jgi:hypothetical protein
MMRALPLLSLPLAACVAASPAPAPVAPRADVGASLAQSGRAVRVTRTVAPPYAMWDGAGARRDADALCGGKVRSSIYDRYEAGTWVFVEGCA